MADFKRNQAIVLLAGEILLIASSAIWSEGTNRGNWLAVIYAGFFCMGGYLLANSKSWLISYVIIALIGVTSGFLENKYVIFLILNAICVTLAQAMLFYAVLNHSFLKSLVAKSDRVIAGVAGYLLLGLFWTSQFDTLLQLNPNALYNIVIEQPATQEDSLYFSFVTLMALGYGDLVPTTAAAKVIAVFTSLTGVLYLAVFISALVGRKPR